jgi:predicted dehydrogenase
MACHCYDLLRMFMGEIVQVAAFCNTLTFKYRVEDAATTLVRFESGAHATVDTFFCVPDAAGRSRLELYGNKGSILAEGTIGQTPGGDMVAYLSPQAKGYDAQQEKASLDVKPRKIAAKPYNTYTAEIEALSDCILKDKPVAVNGLDDSLVTLKVIEAAYRSAKTGKVQRVK